MKFRNDLLKFGAGLFIGMSLYQLLFEGGISNSDLLGNAIGGLLGGLIYAYWTNRKYKHEVFRKKK